MKMHTDERRRQQRMPVSCPVSFYNAGGELVARGTTVNLSATGALTSVPLSASGKIGRTANLTLCERRGPYGSAATEDFHAQARVTRHHPMVDDEWVGLALQFDSPLDLPPSAG